MAQYNAYPPQSPYRDGDLSPVEGSHADFPPPPPAHRNPVGMHQDSNFDQMQGQRQHNQDPNNYSNYSPPGVSPGTDNLGEGAAGGGINGIALGVAGAHERESGLQALRDIDGYSNGPQTSPSRTPFADQYAYDQPNPPRPIHSPSHGSNAPFTASAIAPAGMYSSNSSQQSMPLTSPAYPYSDSPYNRYSSSNLNLAPQMGQINPNDLADDDDWGMGPTQQKRRSFVPFGNGSREGTPSNNSAAAIATGAAAGGLAAGGSRDGSGSYNAVPNADQPELVREKSEWLDRQTHGRKKMMWIVIVVLALIIIGAIVGGVLGSVLRKGGGSGGGGSSGSSGSNADSVREDNKNDLSKDSDEIKKLMGNSNLHKVFPGMDYTPLNAQYPECLTVPPSQNNITRDMAVMSQLTNAVRLYGTDCNQTEMVLHAIDRLGLTDMKVWMGVWLGNNDTTNARQVEQMWELIDKHAADSSFKFADKFKGVIVGNEVLYREDLTETELLKYITDIKSNLTKHGIDLPVATSDLGDNWTADMATKVDVVMSNVHPFFAGVQADVATSWTWTFWQTHDVYLTASNASIGQVIAEVGWPTAGGNNCGESDCTSDTQGSVAGIDELNTFMEDWVCPSLKNGTEYFWFSAFDEPWKIRYNEKGKEWEDKWGLMDVNRNLKKGVSIPDCDGQTVPS
ncbi:glycoside hydrolase family 17 protein [Lentithecium fluviatile CBS 122367]|uniref:glucan endo-1,3-beta-D-glucosidase n=1 Tax=Lentithecium fluviatile CBS 122367 TaxID=1168545 RepID=A0A6G1IH22_9PLEO|nr:glycoside hydrolase family 17 protein [Lentithecium fluviatile CBS 122367]